MRTRRVAPGLTALWPDWLSVLACRNASPEPSDNATNPNPFSGLNHLTVASCSGPKPAEEGQDGAARGNSPGGARSKLKSSSKPRRRLGSPRPRVVMFERKSSPLSHALFMATNAVVDMFAGLLPFGVGKPREA